MLALIKKEMYQHSEGESVEGGPMTVQVLCDKEGEDRLRATGGKKS